MYCSCILQLWILCYWIGVVTCENTDANCNSEINYEITRPAWLSDLIPENYSSRPPPHKNGCSTVVYLECFSLSFGEISVVSMTVEVEMKIYISWLDNRLNIPTSLPQNEYVTLDQKYASKLWSPVIEFNNCIKCKQLEVGKRTKLWLNQGMVQFHVRSSNKFRCNFDLTAFPMDTQECFIEFQLGEDDNWSAVLKDETSLSNLTTSAADDSLTEFKLGQLYARECSQQFLSGNIPCVSFGFTLKRRLTYHLMLTYGPSLLIVILSWLSFCLDADASAPRVTIGLTSLLTLATQFVNAQKNLPAVSYVKAIDIWMFVCMFMVFSSLLEFAIVNNVARIKKKRSVFPLKSVPNCRIGGRKKFPTKPTMLNNANHQHGLSTIDKIAQILFPTTFIVFNACYWGYYCYIL